MDIFIYDLFYIVTNVFSTYIIFKFMNVFFDRKGINKTVEIISYIGYFIFITLLYLFINIPIVMMIGNLITFILLSFNYEATLKKRLFVVVFQYLILMLIEVFIGLISGYINFPILDVNNYSSIYGLLLVKVISYTVVLVAQNYKNIKKGKYIPNSNWFSIILIPTSSLYIALILFQAQGIPWILMFISIIVLLLINCSTFQLYDIISAAISDKLEKKLFEQQSKYYGSQLTIMKLSLETTNTIKHDLKNHLLAIYAMVENGEKSKSLQHIANMIEVFATKKEFARSGNINFDSILNFKLQEAQQKDILAILELNIPSNMDIPSFDMAIILGNLLDNAIKANDEIKGERYINIAIKYDKGRLIIKVQNPYEGEILKENGRFLTMKKDRANHGIGLVSIKNVLQKYNGMMEIDYSKNVFCVKILMFIDKFLED